MDRFGDKVNCNPKVKLNKNELYPLIDIDKINPQNLFVKNQDSVEYTGQSCSKFENGDVLMARITPCLENGKIAVANIEKEKGFGSTELFVFRGIDGVSNTKYIYYLLCMNHMRQLATNSMTGASGRQRADLKFIQKIKWEFPNIDYQNEIVNILSKYDELIELNNKRIRLLEQTAEELYKEWFVRFRFPNYQNTEFENGIPKGWNYRSIKEVYNTTSGGTPSRSNESFYTGNIPWIKTGELSDCPIIQTDEYITEEAVLNSSAKILKEHSLIIAMYGATIGKLGINDMPATCNQACCAFTPKQEALDIYYLYQYLKSNRDFLIGISNGAAQQNLSQDLLRRLKILLPPISIITQYNKIVDRLYKENVLIRKQNKNLIKQRDLLLPRLMSGKLEVK